MNRLLLVALAITFAASTYAGAGDAPARSLFVSSQGNDAWSGALPAPNEAKTDGPFATLVRARDEVRRIKTEGAARGNIAVVVRGGTYTLDAPLSLTGEDSGKPEAPVIYMAFPGEDVRLSGGVAIDNLERVTDETTLSRLDEHARGHVFRANLKDRGITDFGLPGAGVELFFQDNPMTLSRWPNEGFVNIVDIVVDDGHQIHGIKGSKVGQFKYEGDRPTRWINEKDAWVHGYWFWDWSEQRHKVASIDTANSIISVAEPYHGYGYRKGQWFYALNLLCEIDMPGEWYIDREEGVLYFWPTDDPGRGKVILSNIPSLFTLQDVSHVTLQGFTLEAARDTAITIAGGSGVHVRGCTIRNVGGWGVTASGEAHLVSGCDMYRVGKGCVSLSGGDRASLTPGKLAARDNHLHHYGRVNPIGSAGVSVSGVGNIVANNLIHDAPHMGIFFSGNDHLFEYNELHHVCEESNDAGAMYAGRDWTMRGHIIRYNYFHDIRGFLNKGCVGVYLDDMFASATIYGNVFHKVTRAAFIGGGRDNTVENNIFVDCDPALHIDARAMNWAGYHADDWIKEAGEKGTILGIDYTKPPYSRRYPQLPSIIDDEPKAPKGNRIARNICVGGKWEEIEEIARPYLDMEGNMVDIDPKFVDAERLDFRLQDDSPAYENGFAPIPMDRIGPFNGSRAKDTAVTQARAALPAIPELGAEGCFSAWMGIGRSARAEGHYADARKAYRSALDVEGLGANLTTNARFELAGACLEAGNWREARKAYETIATDSQLPVPTRALAWLSVAKDCVANGQYERAQEACARVLSLPSLPPHLQWEAESRVSEIVRLEQGLPARDPEASRVRIPARPEPGLQLYVSPAGADANAGTADAPFATPQRAAQAIAELKAKGPLPAGGVTVNFREGVYSITQSTILGAEVSGAENAPVVFRSHPNERAVLCGGAAVSGFAVVNDAAVLARLPEEARGKVWAADLKAQGITDYGVRAPRGFAEPSTPLIELYFNDTPLTPARWPNEGFVRTGEVADAGDKAAGRGAVFAYSGDRPSRWTQAKDIWLYGYWFYDWADNAIGVASIDVQNRQIHTQSASNYGVKAGQEYYAFNLLEEIDRPGEWYLDRDAGVLYVYPPSDPAQARVFLSMLNEPMVQVNGASHVVLENLTLELGRGDAIHVSGGDHCLLAGCTVRRFANAAVVIDGGANHGVLSCDLHTLGRGGVVVSGGDRKTLSPGGHFIENCDVHDFSRIDRTYTPAVYMHGVGNRIVHNKFHDTPCHAMRIEGNDHVIEFNDVFDVVRESDDQGAIDMFYNFGYRGNVIRYNHFHDIGNGRGPCGQAGVRLDDAISGTVIYGNIFERCSEGLFGGVQIHGGKDNWVDNNLFIECRFGVSLSGWGEKRWNEFLDSEGVKKLLYQDVDITQPPYATRYPELARLREGVDVNRIWRNVLVDCGRLLERDRGIQETIGNQILNEDPGFFDREDGDLRLRRDSRLPSAGAFVPIPVEEIGLYGDAYRESVVSPR
ncbi:MAG: right-handed parallel beta-helix repeat-containing protein [Candidatus Hydrogenedentes bacterium]|nr:right-handed parallel beta-helix repeat-containing protein [Candidatus Hydrogenedentota bacterium]